MAYMERYWLRIGEGDWCEVSKEDYVAVERMAGFNNTMGEPKEPATSSWSAGALRGKLTEQRSKELLDLETAQRLAQEVVDERGRDFVYNTSGGVCFYVPRTDPRAPILSAAREPAVGSAVTGCLVGEILNRAGLLTDRIASAVGSIRTLADVYSPPIERKVVRYLSLLQRAQDCGAMWGDALDRSNETIARGCGDA